MRINKDQITISRWKDLNFNVKRGKGHLPSYLWNRIQWHYYPRLRRVARFPLHLDLELTNLCNMRCPMCFTVTQDFKQNIDKGFMRFNLFEKIVQEASAYKTYSIRLSHRGEAFLHPEIVPFIRYAKQAGIKEVASLSNILALTPELFEKCLRAGLDWLTISFDGLGETYEWIRQPAKFDEAYRKVQEYKRIKERHRSLKPVIRIQSIWPAIKDCAEEYVRLFSPYVDAIASNPLIDYLHQDDPQEIDFWPNFDCPTPYQRLTVLFNGLVPYCHNDEFITMIVGDATSQKIFDIWHGPQMSAVRQAHRRHRGVAELPACKHCFLPRKVEPVNEFIGDRKIRVEKYTKRTQEIGA